MIDQVKIKKIKVFGDSRGNFREILKISDGLVKNIEQVSLGVTHPQTIKAFHWHQHQDDIFYVLEGNLKLVMYDARSDSKTHGETVVLNLGESYQPKAIFIPRGVYHGYKVLGNKDARVIYIMNNQYDPKKPDEHRVPHDHEKIGFNWKDKVLVVGAGGFLGKQLVKDLKKDFIVKGTFYPKVKGEAFINIADKRQVKKIIEQEQPDIVILTAAKTNVEKCESEPKDTYKINVLGVKNIVESLKHQKIVFYSTDSVFDGNKKSYTEKDVPHPLNVYSKSKSKAEKIVSRYPNHLICRTSRLYGPEGEKFLNKVFDSLKQGKKIQVPTNTPGNFTLVHDLSRATIELIKKNKTGIFHVAGKSIDSFDEAAFKIAKVFGFQPSLISKVDKNFFNSKVKRPNCPLSIKKLEKEGIKMSSLDEGLKKFKGI